MVFFREVSNRFWNYVSPRKTQQRRDKEFKVPAIPVRPTPAKKQAVIAQKKKVASPFQSKSATPESRAMSPNSRVKNWTIRTPSPLSDVDMDQTLLPPSPPASISKQTEDELEGDTLVESPTAPASTTTKTGSSGKEVDANGHITVVDDGNFARITIDVDEERKRRDKQGQELRAAGWSEDAVFLFQKLGMRGFEPILPIEWLNDLETLPEDLFTARPDKVFLRPVDAAYSASYRGMYFCPSKLNRRLTRLSPTRSRRRLRPRWTGARCTQNQVCPTQTTLSHQTCRTEVHDLGYERWQGRSRLG